MRYEAGIAGGGGQGIVLMATILAEAIASDENLYVAQTQSYDPAVRGGRAEAGLVISDEEIDYPDALELNLMVALNQAGYERNAGKLKKNALVVVDNDLVSHIVWHKILRIPFTAMAGEKFKDERVANMIALGALINLCKYLDSSAVENSISSKFKGKLLDLNLSAFREGVDYGARVRGSGFDRVEEEDIEI
ncbi:MAG: 2-oxoacid:acceptor oxidoreductase family protein [Dehalococcoidia bacterium]